MAVTGRTTIPLVPVGEKVGPVVYKLPEMASATFPIGALLSKSAGSIRMHTTGYITADLYGMAISTGKNGSADGVKTNAFYRFQYGAGKGFKIAISGSLHSSQLGNTMGISQNTAGQCFGITATTASNSVARMVDFADGFVSGDTNPVIWAVPLSGKVQEG